MSDIRYLTTNSPTLTLKLGGKRYQAANGLFKDLPEAACAELDHMIKTMPHIRQEVRKVDLEAAAEVAKKALERQRANPAAIKGPVTSASSASNQLRAARQAQTPEALTGKENPVNISTNAKDTKPVEVTQIATETPANPGSLLNRMKKS